MASFHSSMALEQRVQDIATRLFALDSTELTVFHSATLEQKIKNLLARIETLETGASIAFVSSASMNLEQRVVDLLERLESLENAGAGGGGYVAKAVHFDGTQTLNIASLVAPVSGLFAFSVWVKSDWDDYRTIFVVDPAGQYAPVLLIHQGGAQLFQIGGFNTVENPAGDLAYIADDPTYPTGWTHYLGAGRTDLSAGLKLLALYQNDILIPGAVSETPPGGLGPWNVSANGYPFLVGNDGEGSPFVGDMADLIVMPGVNLLDGTSPGGIAEATRRLFISPGGKPVNPASAIDALGDAAVLFSGDSSSFSTNQGTGGAFTLTGSLSDASTSPSD